MNSKTNIVIFGNCQAWQIKKIMSKLLPRNSFYVENYRNNSRTEKMKSNAEILSAISNADIFIYQPLAKHHGELSEESILNVLKKSCKSLSFPYIFNSGVYSLCLAPQSKIKSYGKIYGEESIIELVNHQNSKQEILTKYKEGSIDFGLVDRFNYCLEEMKKRENSTTIKLSSFILDQYKCQKLFSTHNHPTNNLFNELFRQVKEVLDIPLDLKAIGNISELPETICPISPYDIEIHGYKFEHDENWYLQGKELIEKIIDEYLASE